MRQGHSRSASELDELVLAAMETSCVIIIGVSRSFKNSITCQRIARHSLKLQAEKKSVAVLYALLQGDFTLMSIPEKVTGWLGHMLKVQIQILYISMYCINVHVLTGCDIVPLLGSGTCERHMYIYFRSVFP